MNQMKVFNRTLGPFSASALIVGSIVGTGIFFFVSDVGYLLRNPFTILAAWAIGGLIALLGAFCLSELAATYPETGGIYIYLRKAFGPLISFEYAWSKFLIMRVGSYSIQSLAFAYFTAEFFSLNADKIQKPMAVLTLAVICIINMIGVKWGGFVQNVLTSGKVISLLFIILIGAAVAAGFLNAGNSHTTLEPVKPSSEPGFVLFGLALIAIMWTFGGWDESPFVAEEIIRPERNIPLSLIGGLAVCVVLYVLTNASYMSVLSIEEFASSGGRTATLVLERVFGEWGRRLLSLLLMMSTFGAANGMILTGARIAYASGRDNAVFGWFAQTHHRTKTPIRGLLVQFILGSSAIVIMNDPFKLLIFTGFAYWFFTALIPIALFILRRKDAGKQRPFQAFLYPVSPVLFFIAALAMIGAVIKNDIPKWSGASWMSDPPTLFICAVIFITGAAVFFIQRKTSPDNKKQEDIV